MTRTGGTDGVLMRRILVTLGIALCFMFTAHANAEADAFRGYAQGQGWQYAELGEYPQTLEGGLEPILWRVLSVDGNSAYLVSEYVLLNRRIHPDDYEYMLSDGNFVQTEMYGFLNGAFLKSFTADELAMLAPDADGGVVTLLSADDLRNPAFGFVNDASRAALGTPYALQNGLYSYSLRFGNTSPYWTRTQNADVPYGACCTKAAGNVGYIRVVVQNEGCRPACTLRLDKVVVDSGEGTAENPFRLKLNEGSVTK